MSKRAVVAAVLVFIAWNLLDFLVHGALLMGLAGGVILGLVVTEPRATS